MVKDMKALDENRRLTLEGEAGAAFRHCTASPEGDTAGSLPLVRKYVSGQLGVLLPERENPGLVRAYNTYHDRGFDISGVARQDQGSQEIEMTTALGSASGRE